MDKITEQKYIQTLKKASDKIKELLAEINSLKQKEPIAIIGMGCRFPGGANSPEAFWNILKNGMDTIREIPKDRWDSDPYYDPDPEKRGKTYTKFGGFLDQVDFFDADFFGISRAEAESLDPQQRLLMEVSWEALESAGIDAERLKGSKTGVFIGMCSSDYAQAHLNSGQPEKIDEYCATGIAFSTATGRLSYFYDFHGPSLMVDTACSSSLVSLHLAIQSLHTQESDMAIAGGVSMILSPEPYIAFSKLKALSQDGRCRTFDDNASGYSKGEGCGLIVLKRLSDAIRDNDPIFAVIKGIAVNQDGESSGLTAPNALSQKEVILKALEHAKCSPDDIDYIEAHGTGTRLGDPIEARALGMVFSQRTKPKVVIGSVKTNIGHLEGAAGIASIIKVILALQHEHIPPTLHFQTPSHYIPWHELPITVCSQLTPWRKSEKKRIAGISSFGFSGTNAHVIIQETPELKTACDITSDLYLLPLSAKNEKALRLLSDRYRNYLSNSSNTELKDICYTASVGRAHFKCRRAVIGKTKKEVIQKLSEAFQINTQNHRGIVFLFTGQGAQYPGMAKKLYDTEPVFKKTMDHCDEILKKHGISLLHLLYGSESNADIVNQTAHTQPLLFAVEYSLAELWRSWGVKPSAVIGHSIGEYVAACVSGVFSLEDGLMLSAMRGKVLQSLPNGGTMAAIFESHEKIREFIDNKKIALAAVNSPKNVVISGKEADIVDVLHHLSKKEIRHTLLQVSHAFHSYLTEPILDKFHHVISGIRLSEPVLPLISNCTGKQVCHSEITKPDYWCQHLRQTVRFYDGVKTVESQGYDLFLEIGPHAVLTGLGKQCLDGKGIWLPSLIRGEDDYRRMMHSLAQLYGYGVKINWSGVYNSDFGKKILLPNYPFQRQRYWKSPVREINPVVLSIESVSIKQDKLEPSYENSKMATSEPMTDSALENSMRDQIQAMSQLFSQQLALITTDIQINKCKGERDCRDE
ncbi:MAG: type I polyketide synthase [Desulfobacterales bacterium]|nr:type I polyketide synthase [Desulfobacterales bacterium]